MIVQRLEFNVKPGRMDEAVRLSSQEGSKFVPPGVVFRIYRPQFAPWDVFAFEMEFEDMAECQALWARLGDDPEWQAYVEKWNTLVSGGGSNYTYTLVP